MYYNLICTAKINKVSSEKNGHFAQLNWQNRAKALNDKEGECCSPIQPLSQQNSIFFPRWNDENSVLMGIWASIIYSFLKAFFCYWLVDMCSHKKCEGPNCPRTNEKTSEELLSILSSGPIFAHILLRMTWISSLIFYYRPTKRPTAMVELRTTT